MEGVDTSRTSAVSTSAEGSIRTTWVAAAFGLLVGVTMVYVPYEFGAPIFRYIYPFTRLMGAGFICGGLLLAVAALYPEWPRAVDVLGRTVFLGTLGFYWWYSNVLVGGWTGAIIYPLLMIAVGMEGFRRFRRPGSTTFVPFIAFAAVGLGGLMMFASSQFPAQTYEYLQPLVGPTGALFAATGGGMLWAFARRRPEAVRWLMAAVAVPFAYLGVSLALSRSWSGAELYSSIVLGCALYFLRPHLRLEFSIRWRLWRGMVLASCIPLLALGGLACVLMQRAIESRAVTDAARAVSGEVEWLSQYLDAQRDALNAHANLESFREAVRLQDREVLELSLQVLGFHASGFDSLFVTDADGTVLARTRAGVPARDDVSDRPYFTLALVNDRLQISAPYLFMDGQQRVSLAIRMEDEQGIAGVLVGTLGVDALSRHVSLASRSYSIRVVDRRNGQVLRERGMQPSDGEIWLPPPLAKSLASAERGAYVGADSGQHQVLVTWERVPDTEWVVVAQQDVAAAYAFITRLGIGAVVLVSVAAILALLLSQWVAHEVTRRLRRVREAAEALARGQFSQRVPPEGGDELSTLAASFNQMADQVQLAHEQLERINLDLQAAVRMRDEFLSLASHELRTPLTPLKATAQTLRMLLQRDGHIDRERFATMLERVDRQTDRLALLVSDMLDISRIQSGRFSLNPQRMDLSALVTEVVERIRSVNAENAERLRVLVPPTPVEGVWDAPRLEQVLVNLLENAIRYSPQGGPILVTLRDDGDTVRLTVADEGIGIPPESLTHLFEPFFRASNAQARHYGGLGLGLHICREIASRHGGRIWAESEGENRGSHFHLELPRQVPSTEEKPDAGERPADAEAA